MDCPIRLYRELLLATTFKDSEPDRRGCLGLVAAVGLANFPVFIMRRREPALSRRGRVAENAANDSLSGPVRLGGSGLANSFRALSSPWSDADPSLSRRSSL